MGIEILAALALPMPAVGSVSATLAWSPSPSPNVSGYNIYYGTTSRTYTNMIRAGNVTCATIEHLEPGRTYYFANTSYNATGDESLFSNEAAFAGCNVTAGGGLRWRIRPPALNQDQLVFSLAPGAPAGMGINPTNGLLSWNPSLGDANSTNTITVIVTDLTHPAASTQETLMVTVFDCLHLTSASVPVQAGQPASLPLTATSSDGITNLVFNLTWPGGQLLNPTLTLNAPVAGGTLLNQGTNLAIHIWTANGDALTGTNHFAQIHFQAAAGQPSAFLEIPVASLSVNKADGSTFANATSEPGLVIVVAANPLLRASFTADHGRVLTLYANPGRDYQLQFATDLTPPVSWQPLQEYQPAELEQTVPLDSAFPVVFYRLMQK